MRPLDGQESGNRRIDEDRREKDQENAESRHDRDVTAKPPDLPKPPPTGPLEAEAIFAPLEPVNWLCRSIDIAPGAPLLSAGNGYGGKTISAQELAIAVATGTKAWGLFPVRQGRVVHLDWEQGSYLTRERYQRLARGRGIDPRELNGRLKLYSFPPFYLDSLDLTLEFHQLCEKADLVIVDSNRAACPSTDENASGARQPLDNLTRISERTGTVFDVIHHSRKPTKDAQGGARASIRGSGALFDACASVLVFSAQKGKILVSHEKARISGRTHPGFSLEIADVEIDGNPRAGLRVTASSIGGPSTPTPASTALQAVKERVLARVVEQGGRFTGAINRMAKELEARKEDVSAAIAALIDEGQLDRTGSQRDPVLVVPVTGSRLKRREPPEPVPGTSQEPVGTSGTSSDNIPKGDLFAPEQKEIRK